MQAEGIVSELILSDGAPCARVRCPPGLIPAPGQYVLAHAAGSDLPLADALFAAAALSDGFVTAQPVRAAWTPGTRLHLRGPLGHGFSLPTAARRIALVPFKCPARALLSLLEHAFRQEASVTLVGDDTPDDLPLQVEVQPAHALAEVIRRAPKMKRDQVVIMNLSGRGDKDMEILARYL